MDSQSASIHVILPAGGSGTRFGGKTKKQFLEIAGKSILDHTVQKFLSAAQVKDITLAVPKESVQELRQHWQNEHRVRVVNGGSSRAESVYNGFCSIDITHPHQVVLVHDAVRPLLSLDLIDQIAKATRQWGAVVPGLPVTDTIKIISEKGLVVNTPSRSSLRAIQTPQGFQAEVLQKAYKKITERAAAYTDEAMLVEACGFEVRVIDGEENNFKITRPEDLEKAEKLLQEWGT
ncbi:MAG: 2-C-methyl-D-erythritol 4-phosphate cytidylyltransferase [Deltaproteobacteria bacterium]|nr:2-C-methyl-D-erythritol 4-phosphate cytidylyltransferase [Deltaproteobacteria bacterium]